VEGSGRDLTKGTMSVFTSTKSGKPQKPQLVSEPRFAPGPPNTTTSFDITLFIQFSQVIYIYILLLLLLLLSRCCHCRHGRWKPHMKTWCSVSKLYSICF
jgi:hypothetical protein